MLQNSLELILILLSISVGTHIILIELYSYNRDDFYHV